MKHLFGILFLFCFFALPAFADEVSVTTVSKPYEIVSIQGGSQSKEIHLGELENFPIMYEINATESFTLTAELAQQYQGSQNPLDLSLMVVRVNGGDRGVTEVARQRTEVADWTVYKDSRYGISFWKASPLVVDVAPGTYRVEVSTPENIGRYMLTLGTKSESAGYFGTLSQIHMVQKFFGYSSLKMLTSSFVYYPLGMLLLLFLIHRTWKYRKEITHAR